MDINSFCISIELSPQAAQVCQQFKFSSEEVNTLYASLKSDTEKFIEKADAEDNHEARLLALYINFAMLAQKEYENRCIEKQIFYDTFADIALWEQEFFMANGTHGIAESKWLAKHVCLQLFRLGQLQFEPATELPTHLPPCAHGLAAFHVHIPKGADISLDAVKQSCEHALSFWHIKTALFLCHSWLLSPEHRKLLQPQSRIVQFGELFSLLSLDHDSRQAEERIFGKICDDPNEYPPCTSLQTTAKNYLLCGKEIPSAEGYFIAELSELQKLKFK